MNAIVSVTDDWGIGFEGGLLVRNPQDMRRFVDLTSGHTVLMGKHTYVSLPHPPLKNRRNIVLSSSLGKQDVAAGVEVVASLSALEELLRDVADDEVWLIGGEQLYRELLGCCRRVYVTKNHCRRPADAFFPDLDADPLWRVVSHDGNGTTKDGIAFEFLSYVRT